MAGRQEGWLDEMLEVAWCMTKVSIMKILVLPDCAPALDTQDFWWRQELAA